MIKPKSGLKLESTLRNLRVVSSADHLVKTPFCDFLSKFFREKWQKSDQNREASWISKCLNNVPSSIAVKLNVKIEEPYYAMIFRI